MALSFTSNAGEIRVGYQVAARLRDCTLESRPDDSFVVHGQVAERDAYWLEQGPFMLRLYSGESVWQWRDVSYAEVGDACVVTGSGAVEVRKV